MTATKKQPKTQAEKDDASNEEMVNLFTKIINAGTKSLNSYNDYCDGKITYDDAKRAIVDEQLDMVSTKHKLMQATIDSRAIDAFFLMQYFELKDNMESVSDIIKDLIEKAGENGDLKQ